MHMETDAIPWSLVRWQSAVSRIDVDGHSAANFTGETESLILPVFLIHLKNKKRGKVPSKLPSFSLPRSGCLIVCRAVDSSCRIIEGSLIRGA